MNRKILILAVVFGVGSIITIAYASNTTITNTSVSTTTVNTSDLVASHDVNTTNLFVSGSCTGCGGGSSGEGSYSNYNTVILNTTFPTAFDLTYSPVLTISNNGTVGYQEDQAAFFVTSAGTIIEKGTPGTTTYAPNIVQSLTGTYKLLNISNGTGSVYVIKNESILQQLGINVSQFLNNEGGNTVAISPNGKYIAVGGPDKASYQGGPQKADPRIIIFEGS